VEGGRDAESLGSISSGNKSQVSSKESERLSLPEAEGMCSPVPDENSSSVIESEREADLLDVCGDPAWRACRSIVMVVLFREY